MPKELIISANAHEKKVAILEDGVVTEFYVERVNENTGGAARYAERLR